MVACGLDFLFSVPQIRRVSRRHCALYKFTYLLTYFCLISLAEKRRHFFTLTNVRHANLPAFGRILMLSGRIPAIPRGIDEIPLFKAIFHQK